MGRGGGRERERMRGRRRDRVREEVGGLHGLHVYMSPCTLVSATVLVVGY